MVASFPPEIAACASALVERWQNLGAGCRIDLRLEVHRAMVSLLERTLFLGGISRNLDEAINKVRLQFELSARVSLLDLLNMPQWIPRIGALRLRSVLIYFADMAADVIAARERLLASTPTVGPNDVVDMLLARDETRSDGRACRKEVAGNIFMLFAAGHETSASALCWALYLLSLDSEWRERVESEVDRELPDGGYVEGSFDRLGMTRAVIEETLRLYPPIATINRQAVAADRLGPHEIKPGTFVIVAPYVLHRHRLLWEAPDLFDPSRFLPGVREKIDRYAYLPFGAGARACIGGAFALRALIVTLATIVRAFRLELAPDQRVWPVHRVTLHPNGEIPMILHRRDN
jgi:cytochrome P450